MDKNLDLDYEKFKKAKDPWEYIEKKTIELTAKRMNIDESKVRLAMEQGKQKTALGYALKLARQKRRMSVKKMAEIMKTSEENIKLIESERISNCPLGLITTYLNNLGCILNFKIEEFSGGKVKDGI